MARSFLIVLALGGCVSPDYAALYDTPTRPPGDSLFGVWATKTDDGDLRWRIDSDEILIAKRCGTTLVGIDVDAIVDDEAIRIYDSKHAGTTCWVSSSFSLLTRCSFDPLGGCFTHKDRHLTVGIAGETLEMTKLAD